MFKLYLQNDTDTRVALYNPYLSTFIWEDDGSNVIEEVNINQSTLPEVHAVSPTTPGKKSRDLQRIKLQLGFACNYTCAYCSQNNQRSFANDTAKQTLEKSKILFSKIDQWYSGGVDKLGSGTQLEFWGGETLLYWSSVEYLTIKLREKYPNMSLLVFTNGSLVKKEMVDFALENRITFAVSHDGPTFNEDRAKDPFEIPSQAQNLHYLFKMLNPKGLIVFNATLSPKNFSLNKIREYIANKLQVEPKEVRLSNDLVTPYDEVGLSYVNEEGKRKELINNIFEDLLKLYPFDLHVGLTDLHLNDFYSSITHQRNANTVGQKCGMDSDQSLALDIDGNVLTCQNVTAKGGHKIGHIDQFQNIELNTAYHWSKRSECQSCPVVQICKGSCMFLKDELWTAACNQHYTWGLAYLSLAIFLQTERKLTKIEGDQIRNPQTMQIDILQM